MIKRREILLLSALFCSASAQAQTETTIKIRVEDQTEKEQVIPVEIKRRVPKTETTVKEEKLRERAGAGQTNIFKAIELTPSLNVQTDDAYGLGGGSIRLRGFDDTQVGVTIDGMPLNDSGNYRLYPHEYADIENLESITVERGTVNKRNPFYAEIGGGIRVRTKPPADKLGFSYSLKLGTNEFRKTFVRLDTGYPFQNKKLPKTFLSYSHTEADKWKGPGKHPEYRDHYTVGISHNLGRLFWEFYYDLNVQLNYFYRGFRHSEITDNRIFRRRDYNDSLIPGNNSHNVNYYKLYKNPYTNHQLRANIELDITDNVKFSLRPYMWIGRGSGTSATIATISGSPSVVFRESFNYTDRPGVIAELKLELPKDSNIFLGYWYERADLKQWQPQRRVVVTSPTSYNLDNITGFRYNYIQRTFTTTNTPYIFAESKGILRKLDLSAGVRFASVKRDFKDYNTLGLPYYPRDGVYDNPILVQNLTWSYEKTYRKVLPSFSIGYEFTDVVYAYFSYSKNFRVPQNFLGVIPSSVLSQFVANQLKPEEADNFDIGVRFDFGRFYISPSAYYVNYKNRLIRTQDPTDPNLLYLRNAGKAEAKGAELEIGVSLPNKSSLYASLSYNDTEFKDENFFDGTTGYNIKGKRFPDTPEYMAKAGLSLNLYGFRISPSVQYISSRYGNLINTEKVGSYTLVNLSVERKLFKRFKLNMDVVNLTDTKYVGRISPGTATGTYYAGAPFTFSVGISGRF